MGQNGNIRRLFARHRLLHAHVASLMFAKLDPDLSRVIRVTSAARHYPFLFPLMLTSVPGPSVDCAREKNFM